jgi:hypothetical protein
MKTVLEMTDQEKSLAQKWAAAWKQAGPLLEQIRREEIRATDTVAAMELLDGMFTHAVETLPARKTSGLIEQQAIFSRARR